MKTLCARCAITHSPSCEGNLAKPPDAKKVLEQSRFALPETVDDLLASLKSHHIPPGQRFAKDDDDSIHFKDQENTSEAIGHLMGTVPEW